MILIFFFLKKQDLNYVILNNFSVPIVRRCVVLKSRHQLEQKKKRVTLIKAISFLSSSQNMNKFFIFKEVYYVKGQDNILNNIYPTNLVSFRLACRHLQLTKLFSRKFYYRFRRRFIFFSPHFKVDHIIQLTVLIFIIIQFIEIINMSRRQAGKQGGRHFPNILTKFIKNIFIDKESKEACTNNTLGSLNRRCVGRGHIHFTLIE